MTGSLRPRVAILGGGAGGENCHGSDTVYVTKAPDTGRPLP